VDDVVVISRGVLRASGPLESVLGSGGAPVTRVRATDDDRLASILGEGGFAVEREASGALLVRGATPEAVGEAANEQRIPLTELVAVSRSLEDAFFALTEGEA
jgi:ABC-2 type transport system ATP-binding protein